jgi:membrane-associated phospholipid phosphatase
MGLALSLALAAIFTQGMKNLFGKPRPDMLARCNPDFSIAKARGIGGYAREFNTEWILTDYTICQQTDMDLLDDGFKSFPSGHASSKFSTCFIY